MAGIYKNGLVAMTLIVEHACRLLNKFHPAMLVALDAAATLGVISSTEADIVKTFLNSLVSVCTILKRVTGY